ncbi:hypothetical protein F5880DRAFT_1512699 [Lentinula raphanica]|nr:hypothetical protein F5880DRAFT_1512699 [Lentinula raphanica]
MNASRTPSVRRANATVKSEIGDDSINPLGNVPIHNLPDRRAAQLDRKNLFTGDVAVGSSTRASAPHTDGLSSSAKSPGISQSHDRVKIEPKHEPKIESESWFHSNTSAGHANDRVVVGSSPQPSDSYKDELLSSSNRSGILQTRDPVKIEIKHEYKPEPEWTVLSKLSAGHTDDIDESSTQTSDQANYDELLPSAYNPISSQTAGNINVEPKREPELSSFDDSASRHTDDHIIYRSSPQVTDDCRDQLLPSEGSEMLRGPDVATFDNGVLGSSSQTVTSQIVQDSLPTIHALPIPLQRYLIIALTVGIGPYPPVIPFHLALQMLPRTQHPRAVTPFPNSPIAPSPTGLPSVINTPRHSPFPIGSFQTSPGSHSRPIEHRSASAEDGHTPRSGRADSHINTDGEREGQSGLASILSQAYSDNYNARHCIPYRTRVKVP